MGLNKVSYNATSYHEIFNENTEEIWYTHRLVKHSPGYGSQYGLTFGIYGGKNISFEVGAAFFDGKPDLIDYKENYEIYTYTIKIATEMKTTGRYFAVLPALRIQTNGERFLQYVRIGGIFARCSMEELVEKRITNTHPEYYPFESVNSKMEYDAKFSAGFNLSVGCEYRIFDHVYLFGEVGYTNLLYNPDYSEVVEYTYRGEDRLDDLLYNEKHFEFVDEFDSRENDNASQPTKLLKLPRPFSNVNFMVGIKANILNPKSENENE